MGVIRINDRLQEELDKAEGSSYTERISSLIERGKKSRPKKSKIKPPHRYKSRGDGYLDIPEVKEHESKKVKPKKNLIKIKPNEYKGNPCEHRDNILVKVIKLEDGRNRYFYECSKCDVKWKQTGHQPKDTSDITEKKMKQIWNANVKGQGGPEYPGESK